MDFNSTTVAVVPYLKGFLPLLYWVSYEDSSFESTRQVPPYFEQSIPYVLILILVEAIARWCLGLSRIRVDDSLISLSIGCMMYIASHCIASSLIEITAYNWLYQRYCLIDLRWDSPVTWWIAFVTADFTFYWFHRMAHELHILWSAHQVHHSSEFMTLTTALRQSLFERLVSWMFYLPLALAVPPTQYLVHKQLNLVYQLWIHTEVIGSLGPLEYILNTPSHHQVHHGRNTYCIDRNYGGVLIIWDRMFGTFAAKRSDITIHYGLTTPITFFNPIRAQFHHMHYLFKRFYYTPGLVDKFKTFFCGPSWLPGRPRLGNNRPLTSDQEKEAVRESTLFNAPVSVWTDVYCLTHFVCLITLLTYTLNQDSLSAVLTLSLFVYIIAGLTCIGAIYDRHPHVIHFELTRILILLAVNYIYPILEGTMCVNVYISIGLPSLLLLKM